MRPDDADSVLRESVADAGVGARGSIAPHGVQAASDDRSTAAGDAGSREIRVRHRSAGEAGERRWRPSLVGWLVLGAVASGSVLWVSNVLGAPATTLVGIAPAPSDGTSPGTVALPVERTDDVLAGLVTRATGGRRADPEGSSREATGGQSGEVVVSTAEGPSLVRVSLRGVGEGPLTCGDDVPADVRCRVVAGGVRVVDEARGPGPGAAWRSVEVGYADGLRVRVQSFAGVDPREAGSATPLTASQLETIAAAPRWR